MNSSIKKFPFELHLPRYQYCGPGTKLQDRLARGDSGINCLDLACKEHDISYNRFKNLSDRHKADRILAEQAWQRVKAKNASILERVNALLVTNMMKRKVTFGMGLKRKMLIKCDSIRKKKKKQRKNRSQKKKKQPVSFVKSIRNVGKIFQTEKPSSIDKTIKLELSAAKRTFQKKKNNLIKPPRIIAVPKSGGAIPCLLPLFAGLSALGSLTGGAATVAKVFNEVQIARKFWKKIKDIIGKLNLLQWGKVYT